MPDINKVIYGTAGKGITKHIKRIDPNKCLVIKIRQCKATNFKEKELEFVGQTPETTRKFAENLSVLVEKLNKVNSNSRNNNE